MGASPAGSRAEPWSPEALRMKSACKVRNERQSFRAEGVVAQSGPVQLAEDEGLESFGSQARQHHRIGDAGTDFLVDGQSQ